VPVCLDLVGQEVDDLDAPLRHVHHDHLALVEHAEGIHRILVFSLPKALSRLVDVDHFLEGLFGGSDEDVPVEGGAQLEDLEGGLLELDLLGVFDEKHICYDCARIILRINLDRYV